MVQCPKPLEASMLVFSILTLNNGLLSAHKFLSYCSQGHSDSTTLWSLLLVLTKLHSPRPMTRKVNNTLTCTKWSVKYVSSSFTPANGVYVWGFKIHKLELGLSIKEKLQHTTHDVCYGGHSNDVWLLQVNHFQFHPRFEFMGFHFLDEEISKFSKIKRRLKNSGKGKKKSCASYGKILNLPETDEQGQELTGIQLNICPMQRSFWCSLKHKQSHKNPDYVRVNLRVTTHNGIHNTSVR